jgi:hypothetical protein
MFNLLQSRFKFVSDFFLFNMSLVLCSCSRCQFSLRSANCFYNLIFQFSDCLLSRSQLLCKVSLRFSKFSIFSTYLKQQLSELCDATNYTN